MDKTKSINGTTLNVLHYPNFIYCDIPKVDSDALGPSIYLYNIIVKKTQYFHNKRSNSFIS